MNIVVLSPHRDDAAFSVSLAINSWVKAGHCVTMVNVFTRSAYAPFLDTAADSGVNRVEHVSNVRREEDRAFLASLPGISMMDLQLEDAPFRLQCDVGRVCDVRVDPADPALSVLAQQISERFFRPTDPTALVLPLALGHHVDHCVVRDSLVRFAYQLPCAFYEDLPYAMRDSARADLELFRRHYEMLDGDHLRAVICRHPEAFDFKLRRAKLYASQIDDATAQLISGFSLRFGGAERLWANRAWLAMAQSQALSSYEQIVATP